MKYIIILTLLAVAAGCSDRKTIEGHEYIGIWDGRGFDYVHSESCPNSSHHKDQAAAHGESPVVDWEDQIRMAAPAGTEIMGVIAFEDDTLNRHGRLTHYACSNAILPGGQMAYLRLELTVDANGNFRPTPVLHIHTCLRAGVNCYFLFDERGYYKGCNCGGNESIVGLP